MRMGAARAKGGRGPVLDIKNSKKLVFFMFLCVILQTERYKH